MLDVYNGCNRPVGLEIDGIRAAGKARLGSYYHTSVESFCEDF